MVIGEGDLKNKIKLPNLIFLGSKSSLEVSNFLNESEYAIFPSKYENFPLVGLESMACGAITIATKPGFSEYITNLHDGYILSNLNYDSFLEILRKKVILIV